MMDLRVAFAGNKAEGVFHLSGGEIGFSWAISNDDGTYDLRYESGWYCTYTNDGVRQGAGVVCRPDGSQEDVPGGDKRNIIRFEPITWVEACKKYPGKIRMGFAP